MSSESRRAVRGRPAIVASLVAIAMGVVLLVLATRGAGQPPEPPRAAATQTAIQRSPDVPSTASGRPSSAPTKDGLPRSVPTGLNIPAIDVTSRLLKLGLDDQHEMAVPRGADYDRAGWYTGSPTPGEIGPTVIAGHVDGKDGPSIFYELGALKSGDPITVTRADGRKVTYLVYRTERYAKDEFPTVRVYGNTPGAELRLITCSGDVGPDGHYLDNTVVYARLAPA